MKPIPFPEQNVVVAKDQPPYQPLPGKYFQDERGTLTVCWKLTDEEKATVINTGEIWVTMLTFGKQIQPTLLQAERPVFDSIPSVPGIDWIDGKTGDLREWEERGWKGVGWYHWDETGMYCYGPFDSQADALAGLLFYRDALNTYNEEVEAAQKTAE